MEVAGFALGFLSLHLTFYIPQSPGVSGQTVNYSISVLNLKYRKQICCCLKDFESKNFKAGRRNKYIEGWNVIMKNLGIQSQCV